MVWNTQLRLTFNALPFDHRLRNASILNTPSPLKCVFCGAAEDSLRHVYGECEVVKTARASYGSHIGCDLGAGLRDALMLFPATSPTKTLGSCAFNFAVWHLRTHYLVSLPSPPSVPSIVKRLIGLAVRRTPTSKHNLKETTVALLAETPPPRCHCRLHGWICPWEPRALWRGVHRPPRQTDPFFPLHPPWIRG